MSTFRGVVAEFPLIRIDYFRQQPGFPAPLACFLSHVHSDHLVGLESMRAPFVYCSAATKEILLRLEKYHYRMNFAKDILESRNVTYHRSMRKLAKPLPLETPTKIELAPGNSIQATLFGANHCIGAVMFLIQSDSRAILYTGDIRAEPWWVNSLVRNPLLLPYTLGSRRLDCIYLDTTFATKPEPYRNFPSKAAGINELLEKVGQYPDDTVFYFHAWTFGYEDVWLALSTYLKSPVHLDSYRAGIYGSLSTLNQKELRTIGLNVHGDNQSLRDSGMEIYEAAALCGFRNGNHIQPGCLTSREDVRLHSCERGMRCRVIDHDDKAQVVHIIPIVSRTTNGIELADLGAEGGGKGDLSQREELTTSSVAELSKLEELCKNTIHDGEILSKVLALLRIWGKDSATIHIGMQLSGHGEDNQDTIPLRNLVSILAANVSKSANEGMKNRTIRFPYSRHSSYEELCHLVSAFQPRDIFPCTVDEISWTPGISIRTLFGQYCSNSTTFRHDDQMMATYEARSQQYPEERVQEETQEDIEAVEESMINSPTIYDRQDAQNHSHRGTSRWTKKLTNRQLAYEAAIGTSLTWMDFGGLASTRTQQERRDEEL
ncbi:hypothetical protein ACEQ8H_002292 [Pleosporales sp. CAS-2024a]